MFSEKITGKSKKALSAMLSVVMVITMFAMLATVASVVAPITASAATSTEDAILIGKGNSMPQSGSTKPMVNIFLPIGAKSAGEGYENFANDSEVCFKLQFKCKMLSGTQPIIGMLRTNYGSGDGTYSEHAWCYNNDVGTTESHSNYPYTSSSYNSSTGMFTAIIRAYYHEGNYYRNGRWCYLTIGNAEHNAAWYEARDLDASFIMSQPTLYAYNISTGETYGDNLAPAFSDSGCDLSGTYFLRSSGAAQYDNPYYASAGKWHVDSSPALVNKIKVPTNYNTASAYNAGNFTQHAASGTQREYYTNSNYSDLYFEKVKYSNNKGFKVISNINKQMVIIEANHNGEADNRTTDGYQPVYNRPANIFIPINFGQYSMNGAATQDGNFLIKVSMTAVRLEGDGYPVLGRIVGKKSVGSGGGSTAFGKMAKNLHLSGYYGDSSHEQYTGGDFSYNESTGAFVGWIRVRRSDNDYATKWGNNEVITIGNAEHVWQEGTFDTTEFNSSFAISDVKIDVYTCTNPSSNVYAVDSLVAEDIAPGFYAENIDDTSRWAFQYTGSGSNSDYDCIRGNQYKWSVDGATGLVHKKDLTACMKGNHVSNMTHHAATSTTREYWGCATCKKSYADPYGIEQITDISATKQMVVIGATGNNPASLVYPLRLTDFENNQWYKFTCKVKLYGDDAPVVTTLYGAYDGSNSYVTTKTGDDFGIQECTYDASTGILTAYLYGWIKDTINKSNRYPFERINPISGANCALVIGNGRYVGNGYGDSNFTSSYAISDPVLKKISGATSGASALDDAKSKSVTGDNLVNPMTDKTIDFNSNFTATMTNGDNPMTGTIGKWYRTGARKDRISTSDIPVGLFEGTQTPRMFKMAGYIAGTGTVAFSDETFLDSETTYQFDIDYRAFGGATPRISVMEAVGTDSYTDVTKTNSSDTGTHISYRFTTSEGLRIDGGKYGGNVRLQVGLGSGSCNVTSAYIANIKLRKVTGGNLGANHFVNGDFSFGTLGIANYSNGTNQLKYWDVSFPVTGGWTSGGSSNPYSNCKLMTIPDSFFNGAATPTSDSTIAIKATGSTDDKSLHFCVELQPSTNYKLSFKYRDMGSLPTIQTSIKPSSGSNVVTSLTPTSKWSDGVYTLTYSFATPANIHTDPGPRSFDCNTMVKFNFGSSASSKTIYITDVALYKLTGAGGSITGTNLVANLNAIFDGSIYTAEGLESAGDSYTVSNIGTNKGNAITRDLANGWLADSGVGAVSVVKVPSDFFTYKTPQQRLAILRKTVLGFVESDGFDPLYNPNGDATWGDVIDYVHAKNRAVADNG